MQPPNPIGRVTALRVNKRTDGSWSWDIDVSTLAIDDPPREVLFGKDADSVLDGRAVLARCDSDYEYGYMRCTYFGEGSGSLALHHSVFDATEVQAWHESKQKPAGHTLRIERPVMLTGDYEIAIGAELDRIASWYGIERMGRSGGMECDESLRQRVELRVTRQKPIGEITAAFMSELDKNMREASNKIPMFKRNDANTEWVPMNAGSTTTLPLSFGGVTVPAPIKIGPVVTHVALNNGNTSIVIGGRDTRQAAVTPGSLSDLRASMIASELAAADGFLAEFEAEHRVDFAARCCQTIGYSLHTWFAGARTKRDRR